jgi:hypothetical protein
MGGDLWAIGRATASEGAERMRIDKGIPIPEIVKYGRGGKVYPFEEMEIGDSFAFPTCVNTHALYNAKARANRKLSPKLFIVRAMKSGRLRCWRVR